MSTIMATTELKEKNDIAGNSENIDQPVSKEDEELHLLSEKTCSNTVTSLTASKEFTSSGEDNEVFHDVDITETDDSSLNKTLENSDDMEDETFHDIEFVDVNSSVTNITVTSERDDDSMPFHYDDDMLNVTVVNNILDKDDSVNKGMNNGDGSDSGVEICGGSELGPAFQRAFSCNSGGYTSSYGVEDYSINALSCDSSLISCYSDDAVTCATIILPPLSGDGTSEAGSESSSVTGKESVTRKVNKKTVTETLKGAKKDFLIREKVSTTNKTKNINVSGSSSKPRTVTSRVATTIKTLDNKATVKQDSNPVSRKEKTKVSSLNSNVSKTSKVSQSVSTARSVRPGSGNSALSVSRVTKASGTDENLKKDNTVSRSKSSTRSVNTRGKINTDDGRWPSTSNRPQTVASRSKGDNAQTQHAKQLVTSINNAGSLVNSMLLESKATALEKYATLPRRKRNISPETTAVEIHNKNHSTSRDPSLNRAASLRKQHAREGANVIMKSLPPYPRRHSHNKVRIYNETTSQTVLTGSDVENALAGVTLERPPVEAIEVKHQEVQVDFHNKKIEQLEETLKEVTDKKTELLAAYDKTAEELLRVKDELSSELKNKTEDDERRRKVAAEIKAILPNVDINEENLSKDADSSKVLEQHVLSYANTIVKQQHKISDLQSVCQTLSRDLERSLAAQKTLLHQQQELEAEYQELQDFLQAEKSTLAEALQEAENETQQQKENVTHYSTELERRQEECKHLVRIAEQRRQENLALQARLNALEQKSRDLLLQQGAAVSGAAVALSGLGSRLDGLIEQLVASYDISEKDLEDVIFHNEAYSKSNSSVEASPEKSSSSKSSEHVSQAKQLTPSPKRGASFVSAVISAIRNAAAQSPFSNTQPKPVVCDSTSLEMSSPVSAHTASSPDTDDICLELEKEPCSSSATDIHDEDSAQLSSDNSISRLINSESLQNLSQAILNRQQLEQVEADISTPKSLDTEFLSPIEDYPPAKTLVDQVIEVDNLVTKLLKVLRIIQLENDTCVEELHDERVHLAEQVRREQENRREVQDEVRNWELQSTQLRNELQDARQQLLYRVQELEDTRRELQKQRELVESLNQDILATSSAYQKLQMKFCHREQEAEAALKQWQTTGELPSPDVLARIITALDEMPTLKTKLTEKEKQLNEMSQKFVVSKQLLNDNWQLAVLEVRRQYDAIDAALETLQNIQSVVQQCPPLAKLQQDLEESNFHCASSLPLLASDLNANAALLSGNNELDISNKPTNHLNGKV